ncbi:MAG: TlpA disulfide reductase family protein [Candidatus Pseudobacter hemicellulosilyticus]|uniref:TlpA disulfide reductase family protein n=1 Tax=Candidatus Pseudobacter hemicellulosilyticus TaxID=3121375 RepID=A0AAJ6BDD2_9BACT|nr:MAG: TlpA disulfide reductase family protein [Pseudobacter sp.]
MKYTILIAALFCGVAVSAQEKESGLQFAARYARPGMTFGKEPWEKQLNKPVPAFHFNKELNSTALKGKVVVLDFWATWCMGCLVVSHGMDSLLVKETDAYRDVQIIGVNTKEKMVDKGYNAHDYWKKTGKGFPMVDGPAADSCGASVSNGFPTVMVVDDKGIIRKRWDGAGPATAGEVRLEVWKYAVYPRIKELPASWENVRVFLEKKDWLSALYFADALPENYDSNSVLKLQALLRVSEEKAAGYAQLLLQKMDTSARYHQLGTLAVKAIAGSTSMNQELVETGLAIYRKLSRRRTGNDFDLLAYCSELYWKYSVIQKTTAMQLAERSRNLMEELKGNTPAVKEQLDRLAKAFGQ